MTTPSCKKRSRMTLFVSPFHCRSSSTTVKLAETKGSGQAGQHCLQRIISSTPTLILCLWLHDTNFRCWGDGLSRCGQFRIFFVLNMIMISCRLQPVCKVLHLLH